MSSSKFSGDRRTKGDVQCGPAHQSRRSGTERGLEGLTVFLGGVGSGGLTSRLDLCAHSLNSAALEMGIDCWVVRSTPNRGTAQRGKATRAAPPFALHTPGGKDALTPDAVQYIEPCRYGALGLE